MSFSPARVVALLAEQLGIDDDPSSATREERKLAGTFAHLLREAGVDALLYDFDEEIDLLDPMDDDESDPSWTMDDLDVLNVDIPSDRKRFQFSKGTATLEKVVEAAAFYRSTTAKAHKSLSTMQAQYRFIGTEHDLRKLEQHAKDNDANSSSRVSRVVGLQHLSNALLEEVQEAFKDGFTLHDVDLAVMALNINHQENFVKDFIASPSFITRFKAKNRICSRQTTKFVSKINHEESENIKKAADEFVASVRDEMKTKPLNNFCNADQSGFLKEMHSKRSLAPIGDKTVVRCVQSTSSLTHSYTVLPIIYADGSLGDLLYVVLQEPGGSFPKKKKIFAAPNLCVSPGTSHIMTKAHMKEWINKCIFTASTPSSDLTILLDSWTSFRDKDAIDSSLPIGTTLETRQIPPGATGLCQPLDVYFFRPFKALVRRIQGYGFKNFPDFIAYQRDSILKVISLCYSIMRSPIFRPLIQYSWHAAGYLDSPPASRFLTPVQYCFPRTIYTTTCDSHRCQKMSFIRCPNCQKSLCFNCFVIAFHTC